MKHSYLFFLTCILLFLLNSCQVLLKQSLGIKDPQAQTDDAVQTYAATHFPGRSMYRIDSLAMPSLLRETYKPKWEAGFRPIQFICFAPNGKIICQWASCEGNLSEVLSTPLPSSKYASDELKDFRYFTKGVKVLGHVGEPLHLKEGHYTYLVYWTTWTNRQSIILFKRIEAYLKENSRNKSDVFLVNADYYTIK